MCTWRAEVALAVAGLATLPGCIVESCVFEGMRSVAEIEPPDHVALISVRSSGGRDISVDLEGELVSHSPDVECPAAILRWIAITTCGEADVEVDVVVDTHSCAAGNREPPPIEVRTEQG